MNIVHQLFTFHPALLWPREQILLKITEEHGELCKAFRKESAERQQSEFIDLLFGVYCLAEREGYDIDNCLEAAVNKFRQFAPTIQP